MGDVVDDAKTVDRLDQGDAFEGERAGGAGAAGAGACCAIRGRMLKASTPRQIEKVRFMFLSLRAAERVSSARLTYVLGMQSKVKCFDAHCTRGI